MTGPSVSALIDRYRRSLEAFEAAVAALSVDDLDSSAAPGEWTVRAIIHHVADTEVIAGGRLRLILARDGAPLVAYDEKRLTDASDVRSRPIEASLALTRAIHAATLGLLEAATPAAWQHSGVHEEMGEYTIPYWVVRRCEHLELHSWQIWTARSA